MEANEVSPGQLAGEPYSLSSKPASARRVSVSSPLCVDLATIDCTVREWRVGGGGIGLAIGARFGLEIIPSSDWTAPFADPGPVLHIGQCLTSALGSREAFTIRPMAAEDLPFEPDAELFAAVAAGINASLGRPLGQRELRRLIANNVMRAEDGALVPMCDNGVRIAGALYGGLLVMTDGMEVACRTPLPEGGSMVLVPPQAKPTPLNLDKLVQIEAKDKDKKAHEVLMRLLPAAIRGDVQKIGDSVYRLQLLGSKVVEIRSFGGGDETYRLLSSLRSKGCEIVGVHGDSGIVAAYARGGLTPGCIKMLDDIGVPRTVCRPDSCGMTVKVFED